MKKRDKMRWKNKNKNKKNTINSQDDNNGKLSQELHESS